MGLFVIKMIVYDVFKEINREREDFSYGIDLFFIFRIKLMERIGIYIIDRN